MAIPLICDTNFFYNPCTSIVGNADFEIVGTALTAWELITTFKYKSERFEVLQNAAYNFLSIPKDYKRHPPHTEIIDSKISKKGIQSDRFFWKYKTGILHDITKFKSYDEFDNKEGANKLAEKDHQDRDTAAGFFDEYFNSFRQRYTQDQINIYMQQRDELCTQTRDIFTYIMKLLIERDYGRIITASMIDWHNRTFLSEALIDFNIAYLSGRHRSSKEGVKTDPNDLHDLFMTVYVDRNSYYHTNEKFWKKLCLNNASLKERFVEC